MDNKGFISLEYLFSLFIVIIIASGLLFYGEANVSSSFNIADSVEHRLILDDIKDKISQVNSNGAGFSKSIEFPSDKGYFEITVDKSRLTIEYDSKKGESLMPLLKTDEKYKLISGQKYCISKTDDGKIVIT